MRPIPGCPRAITTWAARPRVWSNFSFTNNRVNGAPYDADGDLLADPLLGGTTNQFDAEGRAVTLEGIGAVYDALGREVEAGNEEVLYGPNGARLGLMSGSTLDDMEVPLPGGDTAAWGASGLEYFRHAGGLGSAVLTTTPAGALASSDHYTAFGFDDTGAGAQFRSFTGMRQWTDTTHTGGQYDFMYREYNPEQGRWWTPDPLHQAAADPANPQSWNEYNYVDGQPLANTDPLGLFCPPGGACAAMDNADAAADFGLGSQSNEFTMLSIPVTTASFGYTPLYSSWAETQLGNTIDLSATVFGTLGWTYTTIGDGLSLGGFFQPMPAASHAGGGSLRRMGKLVRAFANLAHPVELLAANAAMAYTGWTIAGLGLGVAAAGCLEPTPLEPVTCVAGAAAGGFLGVIGLGDLGLSAYFFWRKTLPAFVNWGKE